MPPTIEIVSVGTELLLGETVDTNAAHASRVFAAHGLRVSRRATVGDRTAEIQHAVGEALDRSGTVLVTGGLGPTRDDLTRDAVAALLERPLEFDETVWGELVARWQRVGRRISATNRVQAMVPAGGEVLPNRWGSAPGLWLETARGLVILLPGVPLEMRNLLDEQVMPRLARRFTLEPITSRVLRTAGVPESRLGELLGPLEETLLPVTLAYLPEQASVDLRLTAWGLPERAAAAALDAAERRVRTVVGPWIFATGSVDLAAVVLDQLRVRGARLATAESCTGGMIGTRITAIPGSSEVYLGGVVSYADRVKESALDVSPDTLRTHGAVSEATVGEMVRGVAARFGADAAVAVTGIAGPGGGSDEKPVGTVWLAWLVEGVVTTERVGISGDRGQVRERATQAALLGLWRRVGGLPF